MNRPTESDYTELLIERNIYRDALQAVTSVVLDKSSPLAQVIMDICRQAHHELRHRDPDHYRSNKE